MKNQEYNSLLKEKLEQIKIGNKDITDLTDSLNCRNSYKNLFAIFLSNLKKIGVSDETYRKVEKMIVDESNVKRTVDEHECLFGASMEAREICTFDEMMNMCFKKNGVKFYEDSLKYATTQFKSCKDKGNITDHFLNYAVAHNYDEVQYGTWDDANLNDYYECTLYGYPLGRMFLDTMLTEDGREFISPESLHIRKNLQGLRLGAFLLQKLMKDMEEKHPNEPLVSPTVMKSNVNALKLYNSLGAKVYVDEKLIEDPINGMDHSEGGNCLVVFMPDAIKKYANTLINKPTEKINKIKSSIEEFEFDEK